MTVARGVVFADQIHGGSIAKAEDLQHAALSADGVVVAGVSQMIGVKTADCLPLVIVGGNIGLALHISRKTLVRGLLDNATTFLSPSEIDHVYIGPHICEYHFGFEEEGDMLRRFRYRYPQAVHFHRGKLYVSLRKALNEVFSTWGVHTDKITADGRCTYEHSDLPSLRRHREEKGEGEVVRLRTIAWKPSVE